MEDEINTYSQAEEPETRSFPVPEQNYAQRERCNSTYKGPTPMRVPHCNGRSRPKDARYHQYRADDHINCDCTGLWITKDLPPGYNAEDSGGQRQQESAPPEGQKRKKHETCSRGEQYPAERNARKDGCRDGLSSGDKAEDDQESPQCEVPT